MMNVARIHRKYSGKERRLLFNKAKLKAVSRTSALLSGFAMIALVEVSLDNHIQSDTFVPLIIVYSILTCLVIGVHLLALMISSCLLPLLEADSRVGCESHGNMHSYVKFAWILSTGFGLFLFLLDMSIVCWVKFFYITRRAAIATTIVIVPIFVLFCLFSFHFYRRIVILKLSYHQTELDEIEKRLTIVRHPLISII